MGFARAINKKLDKLNRKLEKLVSKNAASSEVYALCLRINNLRAELRYCK